MSPTAKLILAPSLCLLLAFQAFAASLTVTKPEEVGFSAERLKRVHSVIQGHIDAKDFAGAVTLVARKGKVVHFEALKAAWCYVVLDSCYGLVSLQFSRKPFSHIVVLQARIP